MPTYRQRPKIQRRPWRYGSCPSRRRRHIRPKPDETPRDRGTSLRSARSCRRVDKVNVASVESPKLPSFFDPRSVVNSARTLGWNPNSSLNNDVAPRRNRDTMLQYAPFSRFGLFAPSLLQNDGNPTRYGDLRAALLLQFCRLRAKMSGNRLYSYATIRSHHRSHRAPRIPTDRHPSKFGDAEALQPRRSQCMST